MIFYDTIFGQSSFDICKLMEMQSYNIHNKKCFYVDKMASKNMSYKMKSAQTCKRKTHIK